MLRTFILMAAVALMASTAHAKTCKTMTSCEEAVIAWCGGDTRRDGDNDGIPCENLCPSEEVVDRIREKIGC